MRKHIPVVIEEFNEIRFIASSLAFSTLLSIIPFIIIVLAIFQSIGGLEEFYPKIERIFLSYLSEATGSSVSRYIKDSLKSADFKTLGISGAIFLIWASLGLIRNIDFAFNKIWKVKVLTPMYKRLWLYWVILLAIPLGLALFVGLKSVILLNQSVRTTEHKFLFAVWTTIFIFTLYKIIPAVKVRLVPCVIASVTAGMSLLAVQVSFLWVSAIVFRQNQLYGSLASFPIFLIWLLVVWYVILSGVKLCAFLQQNVLKTP